MRSFAVEQLRRFGASIGVRQAGLLADTVSKMLGESTADFVPVPSDVGNPLIPSMDTSASI